MIARTNFIETEALLIALDDLESDELLDYLAENFLPNELEHLGRACRALSWACRDAKWSTLYKVRGRAGGPGV